MADHRMTFSNILMQLNRKLAGVYSFNSKELRGK